MNFDMLLNTIAALPAFDRLAWVAVLLFITAAIALVLYGERRHFKKCDKAGSWLALRLLALPLLALVAAVLILPARMISGPESLAYVYIALFTLAPLLWFGGHLLLGRLLRPALSRSQASLLASTGLGMLLLIPLLLSAAQGSIFMASRAITERSFQAAAPAPLVHAVRPPRRFLLPGVGEVYTQSLIGPTGLALERIDAKVGDAWFDTKNSSHYFFCRNDEDLHLMWSDRETWPRLRLYWRQGDGPRQQADFTPDASLLAALPATVFQIAFQEDGFDLPVPTPRQRINIGFPRENRPPYFKELNPLPPGESFANDCLLPGYKRTGWQHEGPIQAVALMFYERRSGTLLRAEINRHAPPAQPGSAEALTTPEK